MTQPNPDDINAIGGTHPGTKTQDEIKASVTVAIDNRKTMAEAGTRLINAIDWHMSSFSDPNRSPKYAVDPSVSYYGNGSLSLMSRLGRLMFAANINEANRGAFSLDQSDSSFYSSMNQTTLGSLNIDTVDGYELNQLSTTFPSTNFTPTKPWYKKLFPTLSSKNLIRIGMLELLQAGLFNLIDQKKDTSEPSESKDIALIIVDNKDLERNILAQYFVNRVPKD